MLINHFHRTLMYMYNINDLIWQNQQIVAIYICVAILKSETNMFLTFLMHT